MGAVVARLDIRGNRHLELERNPLLDPPDRNRPLLPKRFRRLLDAIRLRPLLANQASVHATHARTTQTEDRDPAADEFAREAPVAVQVNEHLGTLAAPAKPNRPREPTAAVPVVEQEQLTGPDGTQP